MFPQTYTKARFPSGDESPAATQLARFPLEWTVFAHRECHRGRSENLHLQDIADTMRTYVKWIQDSPLNLTLLENDGQRLHNLGVYPLATVLKEIRRRALVKLDRGEEYFRALEFQVASFAGVRGQQPVDLRVVGGSEVLQRPRAVLQSANQLANLGRLSEADHLLRHAEYLLSGSFKPKKEAYEVDYQMRLAQIRRNLDAAKEAIELAGADTYRQNTAKVLAGMISLSNEAWINARDLFNEILSEAHVSWLYRAESWFGLACVGLANNAPAQDVYRFLVKAQYVYVVLGLQATPHPEMPLRALSHRSDCLPGDVLTEDGAKLDLAKDECFGLRDEEIIGSGLRHKLVGELAALFPATEPGGPQTSWAVTSPDDKDLRPAAGRASSSDLTGHDGPLSQDEG